MRSKDIANMFWEGLALRGIAGILFGLVAVFWPGLTLVTLVYIFSAFILTSGLIGLVMGFRNVSENHDTALNNLMLITLAIIEVGVGVYLLGHVNVSYATFVLLMGLVLITRGVVDIAAALLNRLADTSYRWLTFITGVLGIIVGVIILRQPVDGSLAFVWALGFYGLITGPMYLAMSYDAKKLTNSLKLTA